MWKMLGRRKGTALSDYLWFYLEIVTIYSALYFFLLQFECATSHFSGLSLSGSTTHQGMFELYARGLHFSLVTVSTLGYGNVSPESMWALLLTGTQLLIGLYTLVIGVGSAISQKSIEISEDREAKRKELLELSAYDDVSLLVERICKLYFELNYASVRTSAPATIDQFFSVERFDEIYGSLDVFKENSRISPKYPWSKYIPMLVGPIFDAGDHVLDRYSGHIDPRVTNWVHRIRNSDELNWLCMESALKGITFPGMPLSLRLKSCIGVEVPSKEFLENILYLYRWCEEKKLKHSKENPYMRELISYDPEEITSFSPD